MTPSSPTVYNPLDRDNPQPSWLPLTGLTGSTLAKVWALESLRYGLRPPENGALSTGCASWDATKAVEFLRSRYKELACGSQAFIATLLFDPSMSALPIIPKQNSVSVGLFTH